MILNGTDTEKKRINKKRIKENNKLWLRLAAGMIHYDDSVYQRKKERVGLTIIISF
jgi:hypothetical protein